MNDCLFCKILSGQIPCDKVYEDASTFAFLDLNPVNPGHTLVVHKHHHADIFDTPEKDLCEIFATAKKISCAVLSATKCDGINIGMNNKPAAGQAVFHAHVHVIPRSSSDGLKPWPHKKQAPEQQKATAVSITKALSEFS